MSEKRVPQNHMFHVSSSCPCNLKVALCPSPRRRFLESESQRRSLSQKRFIMPGAIGCNVVNPRITYNHHSTHMGMVYNVPKFCMSHWVQRLILGLARTKFGIDRIVYQPNNGLRSFRGSAKNIGNLECLRNELT